MRRRRNPEIIAGRVNADGSIAAGDGFTVTKGTVGIFTLTFPGLRLIAVTAVYAGAGAGGAAFANTSTYTDRSCQITTAQQTTTLTDYPFAFIAAGVQQ